LAIFIDRNSEMSTTETEGHICSIVERAPALRPDPDAVSLRFRRHDTDGRHVPRPK
jgi:hypothetical protein